MRQYSDFTLLIVVEIALHATYPRGLLRQRDLHVDASKVGYKRPRPTRENMKSQHFGCAASLNPITQALIPMTRPLTQPLSAPGRCLGMDLPVDLPITDVHELDRNRQ